MIKRRRRLTGEAAAAFETGQKKITLRMSKSFSRDESEGRKEIASPFGHATLPQF
jgi:hypothetical protein